jgi:hypothetical protein
MKQAILIIAAWSRWRTDFQGIVMSIDLVNLERSFERCLIFPISHFQLLHRITMSEMMVGDFILPALAGNVIGRAGLCAFLHIGRCEAIPSSDDNQEMS